MTDKYGVQPSDLPDAPKTAEDPPQEPLKDEHEVEQAFESTDKDG